MQRVLHNRRTRAAGVLAAVAVLFGTVLLAALPGAAATQGFVTGIGPNLHVTGTVPGASNTIAGRAGLINFDLEGTTTFAYCIEVTMSIRTGSGEPMTESPWSAANVPNLPNIKRILDQHPAAATLATAQSDPAAANREAAAVQVAIWHFSDNFTLASAGAASGGTEETAAVKTLADQIIADASAHPVTEPPSSLTVTPASATAVAGTEAGPFTVATTATTPLALAVSGGTAEIRDCTTHAVKTQAANNDQVCLFSANAAGPVTLTVSGQAPVDAGRVFINTAHDSQEIILSATKTVDVSAAVQATWTAAPVETTHPAIAIDKAASPTQVQGPASVTFTYVIHNTGDVPLTIVDLRDDHGTPNSTADDLPIGSFKGCDLTSPLAAGASVTCTLSYQLPAVQVMTSQTNTVTVTGKPPTGPNVQDTANATVVDTPQPVTVLGVQTPPQSAPGVVTPAPAPAATPPAATLPTTPARSLPFTGTNSLLFAAFAFALLSLGTFVFGVAIPKQVEARRRRR